MHLANWTDKFKVTPDHYHLSCHFLNSLKIMSLSFFSFSLHDWLVTMMKRTSCIDVGAVANAYPAVTTGPRLLKILIARRDEYRDRDSDLLLPACHSKAQLFGTLAAGFRETKNIATCSM